MLKRRSNRSQNRRRRLRRQQHNRISQLQRLENKCLLTVLFADSFEQSEWNGQWVEDSQNDWKRSTQRESDGSYSAEVDGRATDATLSLANPIDLTTYQSAELTFSWYIESGFDSGEYIALDLFDGTNWNEADSLNGNVDQENVWHNETITIDGSYLVDDFQLRFRSKVSRSSEDGFVDNVQIDATEAVELAEFISLGFLPGQIESQGGSGMSPDGRFVVGNQGSEAYRWSRAQGLISLGEFNADDVSSDGDSNAYRWENGVLSVVGDLATIGRTEDDPGGTRMASIHSVSDDGSVMVGNTAVDSNGEADSFRIVGSVIQPIGDLPGGAHNSGAKAVSADGSVVVGRGETANGNEAYRWENGIFTPLGDLPGGAFYSLSWSVSGDGQFVVGQSESEAGVEAYLWSSGTGMVGLGHLPGETTDSRARGVSDDGSIVVGIANSGQIGELRDAFIWDALNGMRNLQDVLITEYGLGAALTGWTLNSALSISDDGLIIAGGATNPSGAREAFLVDLNPGPILPNSVPVAADDGYTVNEDTVLNVVATGVLGNDTDADADSLTAALVAGPANGALTLNSDGSFTYTPDANFSGSDSFTYKANDATTDSNVATVNLTITPTNDAPVADAQSITTGEDSAIAVTLTGSDVDLDSLTFNIVGGGASNGTLTGTAPNLTYTPGADFNGSDSFSFTVNDGSVTSPAAVVSITVTAVNDAPGITSTAITTATEDSLYSHDVDASDIDVGDTLSFSLDSAPNGMTIDSGTGVIQWTPDNSYVGTHSVTVRVKDVLFATDTQSFDITVANVNDAPTITSFAVTTATEDTSYSYDVVADDPDLGDTLAFSLDEAPVGMTINAATGLIGWAPTNGQVGANSVTVRVQDAANDFDLQSFIVNVANVNDAPTISSTEVTAATEDAAYGYDVDAVDQDVGDTLTFSLDVAPAGM
ncbi:MAG: tandem-95 repeat protein, partial [Fuerstiella sp.]|nr:tandem-95 repeat protein [Fuerstiella sp.]